MLFYPLSVDVETQANLLSTVNTYKRWSWDWNPGWLAPKSMLLSSQLCCQRMWAVDGRVRVWEWKRHMVSAGPSHSLVVHRFLPRRASLAVAGTPAWSSWWPFCDGCRAVLHGTCCPGLGCAEETDGSAAGRACLQRVHPLLWCLLCCFQCGGLI